MSNKTQLQENNINLSIILDNIRNLPAKIKNIIDGNEVEEELVLKTDKSWVKTNIPDLPDVFTSNAIQKSKTIIYRDEVHILSGNYALHYKLDKATNTWVQVSTLPVSDNDFSILVFRDQIHMLGSNYSGSYYTRHHAIFNGDTKTWTDLGTLPYEHYSAPQVACVYNDKLYISGMAASDYKTLHCWDGTTWTTNASMPYPLPNCMFVFKGYMHALCGTNAQYTYSFNGSTWSKIATADDTTTSHSSNGINAPYNFNFGNSAVVCDDEVVVFGGRTTTDVNGYLVAILDSDFNWRAGPSIPIRNLGQRTEFLYDDAVHFIGGGYMGASTLGVVIKSTYAYKKVYIDN